ncbi:MAG: serine/threonine protein kinase [Chloroflexi bacterium]|nr:serine/threonine protein kinase [Chloroflexota bacterium]
MRERESPFRHEWKERQPLTMPQAIGRFQVLGLAGHSSRGSQGRVYKGLEPSSGHYVAIKVLGDQFESYVESLFAVLTRESDMADLHREAQLLTSLNHENIVKIVEAGEDPAHGPYVATEWVAGETLNTLLDESGRLPTDKAVNICLDILEALSAAHAAGVIHLDVKPGNILLDDEGRAKLGDFGIAGGMRSALRAIEGRGTLGYMAPEQQGLERAREIGPATDIYSVGVVLFEMLTGRLPDYGTDIRQSLPYIPIHIVEAISRALAFEPERRFQSASEMASALVGG